MAPSSFPLVVVRRDTGARWVVGCKVDLSSDDFVNNIRCNLYGGNKDVIPCVTTNGTPCIGRGIPRPCQIPRITHDGVWIPGDDEEYVFYVDSKWSPQEQKLVDMLTNRF